MDKNELIEKAREFLVNQHGFKGLANHTIFPKIMVEFAEIYHDSKSNSKYTKEDMKEFGLWLGHNYKKNKNKFIDDLFIEFINQ